MQLQIFPDSYGECLQLKRDGLVSSYEQQATSFHKLKGFDQNALYALLTRANELDKSTPTDQLFLSIKLELEKIQVLEPIFAKPSVILVPKCFRSRFQEKEYVEVAEWIKCGSEL